MTRYLHDVTAAVYLQGHTIQVHFDDGSSGIVDFSEWAPFPGVLSPLAHPDVFATFYIHPEHKTLAWKTPANVDVDPLWLYCRANKLSLPVMPNI
jgi:hypothetical protein